MRCLLCLVLLAAFPLTEGRAAPVPGAAVFVKVVSAADDARSDVYEQRLAGGRARVLVSHTALPKSFRGRIAGALPSADGAVLLLVESGVAVVRNTRTGATRRALGLHGYGPGEEVAEESGGGYWLWWRRTGAVRRIARPTRTYDSQPESWSPHGELLLAQVSDGRTDSLRVFNAATGTARTVLRHGVDAARWTSDGAALLILDGTEVKLASLTGKTQRLLARQTHPGILTAAVSPDGRYVAIGDMSGFSLLNVRSGARRKLALAVTADWPGDEDSIFLPWPGGEAMFSRDGGTLVIRAFSESGPGHLLVHEELWAVQTKSGAATLLGRWGGYMWGDDGAHNLLGWVPGQSALFVVNDPGALGGPETNWRKLWLQPITPGQPARLLVDTGPGGIDLSWWGKPPMPAAPPRAPSR